MRIEMTLYHEDYLIPKSGKYLVRTISTGPLKQIQFLEARCKSWWDEKKGVWRNSIDVNNQTVTHISIDSL